MHATVELLGSSMSDEFVSPEDRPPVDLEPRRAQDRVTQDQAMYGPAVAAQLATLNATVAALHGELYRSLNGLEKATERGFDGVGRRLDKLEDRMGATEQFNAAVEARVAALELDAVASDRREEDRRQRLQGQRDQLASTNARFTVWQILGAVVLALIGLAGTIAGVVAALG